MVFVAHYGRQRDEVAAQRSFVTKRVMSDEWRDECRRAQLLSRCCRRILGGGIWEPPSLSALDHMSASLRPFRLRALACVFRVTCCVAPLTVTPLLAQGARTSVAISAADLRTRLFAYAHDSMMGREPGQLGNFKASAYMADVFARAGLEPAGENGTWFQAVPFFRRTASRTDTLRLGGRVVRLGYDFVVQPTNARPRPIGGRPVVYGGGIFDQSSWIDAETARGKVVVLSTTPLAERSASTRFVPVGAATRAPNFAGAAAILVADAEAPGGEGAAQAMSGALVLDTTWSDAVTPLLMATRALGEEIFGGSLRTLKPGTAGASFTGNARLTLVPLEYAARNVIGVLRGTDPARRGQFVSVSSHNDHVGFDRVPVDHDSVRAFNTVIRPLGADTPRRDPTAVEWARIRMMIDSARKVHAPRQDSIRNGADDDGTGSVALAELAEAMGRGAKPKRSVLFVSHTAEEFGLLGSRWFTDHPTVERDSIIGEIDMDMIGRGSRVDLPDGGPGYLEVIGMRRLSKEFGDVVEAANKAQPKPFAFNLTYDAPGHPLQYYCRADHYSYARYGIPAMAISRGEHMDYHQVTDEPQYIDYDALERVARFVRDAVWTLATRDGRPVLDGPKGDPRAVCRQ
jgi:hypothetical protein